MMSFGAKIQTRVERTNCCWGKVFYEKARMNPIRVGQSLWLTSYHLTVAAQPNFLYKLRPNSSIIDVRVRTRASSNFMFLPSPLHLLGIRC